LVRPGLTAIIAEDDDDARDLFATMLELEGFIVHGAATLAQARTRFAEVRADILIADYSLPDGTGADVLALCEAARPKVCILLTGYDRENVDAAGFDLVLTKPVTREGLLRAIRTSLRE
jgi:two-component system response regulator HydG